VLRPRNTFKLLYQLAEVLLGYFRLSHLIPDLTPLPSSSESIGGHPGVGESTRRCALERRREESWSKWLLLIDLRVNSLRRHDEIDASIHKRLEALGRCVHDRLFVHVEAGIN
jgi:hypothetical protein